MRFHWASCYGSAGHKASPSGGQGAFSAAGVVNEVLYRAKAAAPEVFAQPNMAPAYRQAKVEEVAFWLSAACVPLSPQERQQVVEDMLDRLEIALREASVGDVGVAHQMPVLAAALNGRLQRYTPLIATQNWPALKQALQEHHVSPSHIKHL